MVERFLEKKFRISHSYSTKNVYHTAVKKFAEFVREQYNFDFVQLFHQVLETKTLDPLDVLDDYYTFLAKYQSTKQKLNEPATAVKQ